LHPQIWGRRFVRHEQDKREEDEWRKDSSIRTARASRACRAFLRALPVIFRTTSPRFAARRSALLYTFINLLPPEGSKKGASTMKKLMLIGSIGLALTSTSVRAGLRAWEPADYVQTDLVLHYDGIRNAGADAAHDPDAAVWKDLSPSGNDASAYVHASASDNGAWGNKGFVFATDGYWKADKRTSVSGDFTMQVACDTTTTSMQGTKSWPNLIGNHGAGASGNTDELSIFYHKSNKRLSTKFLAAYLDQYLPAWNCQYATLIRSGAKASLFDGKVPSLVSTSKTGDIGADILVGGGTTDKNDGGSGDRYFTGTIYSVRIYDKALSDTELAWNRALDEARFHGAASVPESALCASVIPDAVVATSVAGANGAESVGCYVVDDDGHTFRAAPFATVGTATYACTGYTLATWDGSAYGAAVAHDGEFACFVAPGDKVRIEWQWEAATGALDVNPYVTDGLVLYYDGIWNAGVGAHDASADIWKDLSATGNDAEFVKLADGGKWLADAYSFETNGHFQTQSAISLGASFTVQTVTADGKFQIYPNNNTPHVVLNADGLIGGGHRSELDWTDKHFLTAMFDVSSNVIAQTTSIAANWWKTGKTSTGPASQKFCIGGCDATFAENNKGNDTAAAYRTARAARTPYHAIRVYSRLLDENERARNRTIDEARFFGGATPPATGAVVVQSSIAGLEGREPNGIYFPDGWTFSAGAGTQTARGIEWQCVGYQLQTWDAASSSWGVQDTVLRDGSNAVEYSPSGTSFASVRLTWLWKPVSGIRTAADYALADYAAGGMQLHLDGLARGDSATVWSDLSGNGRDATLAGNPSGESHWTDDGYFFASNAVFATEAATAFSLGHAYTMQTLGEVDFAVNKDGSHNGAYVSPIGNVAYGSIWLKGDGMGTVQHHTSDTTGAAWDMRGSVFVGLDGHPTYLTALRNGNRAALVEGTAYPTTENTKSHQACMDWSVGSTDEAAPAMRWGIGAKSLGGGADPLYGTVKSVRLYDRLLSEDELAWNRKVDQARFFGALTTTNVVIETKYGDGTGETLAEGVGAYEVFGAHTFSATEVKDDSSKVLKPVAGCYVWTWKDGAWSEKTWHKGTSYDYTTDQGTVKIVWSPRPKGLVLVVR